MANRIYSERKNLQLNINFQLNTSISVVNNFDEYFQPILVQFEILLTRKKQLAMKNEAF
jgi:hypothetical protein